MKEKLLILKKSGSSSSEDSRVFDSSHVSVIFDGRLLIFTYIGIEGSGFLFAHKLSLSLCFGLLGRSFRAWEIMDVNGDKVPANFYDELCESI